MLIIHEYTMKFSCIGDTEFATLAKRYNQKIEFQDRKKKMRRKVLKQLIENKYVEKIYKSFLIASTDNQFKENTDDIRNYQY